MLSNQVIQTCIEELKNITKVDLIVVDALAGPVARTTEDITVETDRVREFIASQADSQTVAGHHFLKVYDEGDTTYVVICQEANDAYMIAKIAASEIQNLIVAYKERFDKNNFFQNLILDNLLLVDIYNRAKKLHIEIARPRIVYLIEARYDKDSGAMEMLKSLFSPQAGDVVTAVDEHYIILVKQLNPEDNYETVETNARTIVDMMNTEAMLKVQVAFGTIVGELKDVSKSFKEAKMALDVGKIFYADKDVVGYNTLGIGRLIYQLPVNLCKMFIEEIFGGDIPEELDEETLVTVNTFLENNLNVSETARQLYVHRNTLLYRLEKLQKATNLDIRVFDDALTLKIALMVVSYMDYLDTQEY